MLLGLWHKKNGCKQIISNTLEMSFVTKEAQNPLLDLAAFPVAGGKKVKDLSVSIEFIHYSRHAVAIYGSGYEVDVSFLGDHAAEILAEESLAAQPPRRDLVTP